MKTDIYHIAIDGPAASGKGTVARGLSDKLGIPYLDTGAMYRGLAVFCRMTGVDNTNEAAVVKAVSDVKMDVEVLCGVTQITVNGDDVTEYLRDNEISQMASNVSRYPKVREKMVELQREVAKTQSFILEGRDIGSVVLPNARFKFYLTADLETRAARRIIDMKERGINIDLKEMMRQIELRDSTDTSKKVGALKQVKDAILIDNTHLNREQTIEAFYKIINNV